MSNVTRLAPCPAEEIERHIDGLIDAQVRFENDEAGDEGAVWCFVETCRIKRELRHHCRLSEEEIEQMTYERREARGIPHP